VSFNNNGGSGTIDSQSVYNGTSITLPGGTTKSGNYVFVSWNTNPTGTGTSYYPYSSFIVSKDITLYAKYSPTKYFTETDSQLTLTSNSAEQKDWAITSYFDIGGLKNAGYTRFKFALYYEAYNNRLISIDDHIYVGFLLTNSGSEFANKDSIAGGSKWIKASLDKELSISSFSNYLVVRFYTKTWGSHYIVERRTMTIEAIK
jgi:hypothetical protein